MNECKTRNMRKKVQEITTAQHSAPSARNKKQLVETPIENDAADAVNSKCYTGQNQCLLNIGINVKVPQLIQIANGSDHAAAQDHSSASSRRSQPKRGVTNATTDTKVCQTDLYSDISITADR